MFRTKHRNKRTARVVLLTALVAALFLAAAAPSFLSSAALASKKLPVYSVKRDDRCVSLTFDAAWGDVRVR